MTVESSTQHPDLLVLALELLPQCSNAPILLTFHLTEILTIACDSVCQMVDVSCSGVLDDLRMIIVYWICHPTDFVTCIPSLLV